MKKYLIALTLLLALGTNDPVAAQTQKSRQQHELVDSTRQHAGLEAFSDTTDAYEDSIIAASTNSHVSVDWDGEDAQEAFGGFMRQLKADDIAGMFFVLAVVLIVFVISPLVIFGLLLFFIFRNRKQKMKLAQMAMQNGQPIPDQLLNERQGTTDDKYAYQSGMRQLFLGIGLMIFLGFTIGKIGVGIGALVFFIGLGKVIIGRKSNNDLNGQYFNSQNQSNFNNHE
jgi:hypothetical protein